MGRRVEKGAIHLGEPRASGRVDDAHVEPALTQTASEADELLRRSPGRPPRRLPAVARYTIRLDARRHDALLTLSANDGDRSLHSIVMEAIDDYVRKRS